MSEFGEEVLVPLAGIFFVFGLPILAWVFFRVLAHRERMAQLRFGVQPAAPGQAPWRAAQGAPPAQPARDPSAMSPECAQRTLRKGIMLTFIGFAITVGLSLIGYHPAEGEMHLGPWLLGGLIPMFVGLAQVIIALLSGASLRPVGPAPYVQQSFGQPFVDVTPPSPPPNFSGPYTYRPDGTTELRPPASPPERRG